MTPPVKPIWFAVIGIVMIVFVTTLMVTTPGGSTGWSISNESSMSGPRPTMIRSQPAASKSNNFNSAEEKWSDIKIIPNQFLVVFHPDIDMRPIDIIGEWISATQAKDPDVASNTKIMYHYDAVFKGVALRTTSYELQKHGFVKDHRVKFVEEDVIYEFDAIQSDAPWGLDRLDKLNLPLDGKYEYTITGKDVAVFVLDSGIRKSHREFEDRVTCSFDAFHPDDESGGTSCTDEVGHGTFVAGVIGGTKSGVAKSVHLHSIKVVHHDGMATTSAIIAGLEFVAQFKENRPNVRMVANLSIGGARREAVNIAAEAVVDAGVTMIVSAGNYNEDSCGRSPSSARHVIAVGASTEKDEVAPFSNRGYCVDLYAPGTDIPSASHANDEDSFTATGTSAAAAHASGVAALWLEKIVDMPPRGVYYNLEMSAMLNMVSGLHTDSHNELLNAVAVLNPDFPGTS